MSARIKALVKNMLAHARRNDLLWTVHGATGDSENYTNWVREQDGVAVVAVSVWPGVSSVGNDLRVLTLDQARTELEELIASESDDRLASLEKTWEKPRT